MQPIMNDTDVLGSLPGKDWLSNVHFNFYDPASMTSGSEEMTKFKSLRRISAYCFEDSPCRGNWPESVHERLNFRCPNAKIEVTSILPSGPDSFKHLQRIRHRQSVKQRQARIHLTSVKAPHIMKLSLPSENYPHSSCLDDQGICFRTDVHDEITSKETELLWFDTELNRWWKRTARTSLEDVLYQCST